MATSYLKEPKPGQTGNALMTWDEAVYSWDDIGGTWDTPGYIAATGYTKESAVSGAYTKETKP